MEDENLDMKFEEESEKRIAEIHIEFQKSYLYFSVRLINMNIKKDCTQTYLVEYIQYRLNFEH